jgi:hypothetical protein
MARRVVGGYLRDQMNMPQSRHGCVDSDQTRQRPYETKASQPFVEAIGFFLVIHAA